SVQRGIQVALARPGLLIDQRHDTRESLRRNGGSAYSQKILEWTAEAARSIPGVLIGLAGNIKILDCSVPGKQRDVGNVALAVIGNSGAELPGRLRVAAAAAGYRADRRGGRRRRR